MLGNYFPRKDNLRADQLMTPEERLIKDRIVFLYDSIDCFSKRFDAFGPTLLMDTLMALDKEDEHKPIKLVIDSPGGFMDIGFAIFDTIKSLNSPVYTYSRSSQSMAVLLLAAGEKGHRFVYKNSRTMLHLPFTQISGNSEDVKVQQKEIEYLKEKMIDSLIECGVTRKKKEILKDIEREFWLSAEEACEYGLADKIVQKGDL